MFIGLISRSGPHHVSLRTSPLLRSQAAASSGRQLHFQMEQTTKLSTACIYKPKRGLNRIVHNFLLEVIPPAEHHTHR